MAATKKKKKARLPKDFEPLLEKGDLAAIQAVFDTCDVNARGGYGKRTALMLRGCTPELARWLVAQGADLTAQDDYDNTALHAQARNRDGCVDALIELGADVKLNTPNSATPLHCAADSKKAAHVVSLLKHGADVNATSREKLTPLDYALQRTSNIELDSMATVARLLVDAGARSSAATAGFIRKLGETFEFHRLAFHKESLPTAERGLNALYELFGVPPVAQRRMHDGQSRISVEADTWEQQFDELWNFLVPSGGAAATVQGEVIRIAGRIAHEIHWNGGANWDKDYTAMAQAFAAHLRSGTPLSEADVAESEAIVRELRQQGEGETQRLYQLAVNWVLLNPEPVALPAPTYRR